MERLGRRAKSSGTVYLTGGSTALLLGIRDQTIDIDLKFDPEPQGAFEAIADLKESLGINVELAAPDQFIPPLPNWKERSQFITTSGKVDFRHYDFYAQALAKIERGHELDLSDATAFMRLGLTNAEEMERLYREIQPDLHRYPAVDPLDFERKLRGFLASLDEQ